MSVANIIIGTTKTRGPDQLLLTPECFELTSLSSAAIATQTFAIPKTYIELVFLQGNGAASVCKFLFAYFNAFNAADAIVGLATPGLRHVIPLGTDGRKFIFPAGALCSRIDLTTDAAETGVTKTILIGGA